MHEQYNFQGNQEELGWDGMVGQRKMDPAVFIYFMEVEYIDGSEEMFKGDVSLIK